MEVGFAGGLVWYEGPGGGSGLFWPFSIAPVAIFLVLPILSLRDLALFRADVRDRFASLDGVDPAWIRSLLFAFLATNGGGAVLIALFAVGVAPDIKGVLALILWALAVFVAFAGYHGLRQRPVPLAASEAEEGAGTTVEDLAGVLAALREDLFFAEEGLTLDHLAARLRLAPSHVTAIIREQTDGRFFDLVNTLRVEEAARLLIDTARASDSILTLAFEAGFQSKATFNRVFKKTKGMTPGAWRAQGPNNARV